MTDQLATTQPTKNGSSGGYTMALFAFDLVRTA